MAPETNKLLTGAIIGAVVAVVVPYVVGFLGEASRDFLAWRKRRQNPRGPIWIYISQSDDNLLGGYLECETPGTVLDHDLAYAWAQLNMREEPRDGDRYVLVGRTLRRI